MTTRTTHGCPEKSAYAYVNDAPMAESTTRALSTCVATPAWPPSGLCTQVWDIIALMVSEQNRRPLQPRERRWFAAELCRPLPVAAVTLLLFNDHVGKPCGLLPGMVTGKLSDLAGLFFFPILLFSLIDLVLPWLSPRGRERLAWLRASATGAIFALIKLCPPANAFACRFWGPIVLDPSDCLALPAVGLAAVWLERHLRKPTPPSPTWVRTLVLGVAAVATMATPAPMMGRNYPKWRALDGTGDMSLGCATASLWASKTGKEGAGITLRLMADHACQVELVEASFLVDGEAHPPISKIENAALKAGDVAHRYLAFSFDGNKAWNQGSRKAQLNLRFRIQGQNESVEVPWRIPLEYRLDDFHHPRTREPRCE